MVRYELEGAARGRETRQQAASTAVVQTRRRGAGRGTRVGLQVSGGFWLGHLGE